MNVVNFQGFWWVQNQFTGGLFGPYVSLKVANLVLQQLNK